MTFRRVLAGSILLSLGCFLAAQQPKLEKVPVKNVSPADGQKMYVEYCAVCHGADGKGNGPAAKALRPPPSDLTVLAKNHGGKFPTELVEQDILGDVAMPAAHGTKEMPMWKGLFSEMCTGSTKNEANMRVYNLTGYIKTLQR